ncbi:MAG TPA: ABC transporter ATP-binding protein [Thermomicrobiales bacterium]|jgi:ABC-2 type transport system ATP-binding protein|nr:ABC transporter ATP-binding protein [Thermomicrobiales bacterium]
MTASPSAPQIAPKTLPPDRRPSGAAKPDILQNAAPADGAPPAILVDGVSKWYGDVVAVSDVSFGIGPGVTALLGPNGAGKSTLLKMIAGLLGTSSGRVTVHGEPVRGQPSTYRRIGLVPEQEELYPFLTGREFVRLNARLQGVKDLDGATEWALGLVEMRDAADRRLKGFSKGMRQRIKVAAALVHDPQVLLMDEPLNGTDPVQRANLIELIQRIGDSGRTVLVSSHVLEEVERFAGNIVVIVNGKLAAAGDYRTIRDRIDTRPHLVRIRAGDPRRLAAALIGEPSTVSVEVDADGRIVAQTGEARSFYDAVTRLAQRHDIRLYEIQPADDSLNSVFAYLVER